MDEGETSSYWFTTETGPAPSWKWWIWEGECREVEVGAKAKNGILLALTLPLPPPPPPSLPVSLWKVGNLTRFLLEKAWFTLSVPLQSTKLQDNGWKPRWFEQDSEDGTYRYKGGYWETRDEGGWDGCLDIFGEFSETWMLSHGYIEGSNTRIQ
jgi:hypothetical protein